MMRIGIDLGGSKIEGIGLTAEGEERARVRVGTPRGDYAGTLDAIVEVVAHLEIGLGGRASVGVGIPGVVEPATGLVRKASSTWLVGHPMAQDLGRRLDRPVRIENDANCFAVSEATDGAGAGAAVVFGAVLGTGCGGGLVMHGQPWPGRNAIAGEWGHTPLPWPADSERPGPVCPCGQSGCLETWISGPGVAADHARATGQHCTPDAITAAAQSGDAGARASLARFFDRVARGLVTVLSIVDPDVVVIGGGLSRIDRLYRELPALIDRWSFTGHLETPIRPARHGDSSGVRGAAWLWPPGVAG